MESEYPAFLPLKCCSTPADVFSHPEMMSLPFSRERRNMAIVADSRACTAARPRLTPRFKHVAVGYH
jgi:hypothetical protein